MGAVLMPRTHMGNLPGKCCRCSRRQYLYCTRYRTLVFVAIGSCLDRAPPGPVRVPEEAL